MLKVYGNIGHFHIPKTAGTSFSEILKRKYGDFTLILPSKYKPGKHCTLSEVKEIYDITQLEKIYCPIRNPYAVAVSLYFWERRALTDKKVRKNIKEKHPEALIILELSFKKYIDWYVNNWISTENWIKVDGKIPKNLIILKMENNFTKTKINESRHKPFMKYYNEETKAKIYEFDKWCFSNYYE